MRTLAAKRVYDMVSKGRLNTREVEYIQALLRIEIDKAEANNAKQRMERSGKKR